MKEKPREKKAAGSPQQASSFITLYKFMEARYAVEAVETLRLKVSTIDSLNDPYEVNPSFIVSENIGKEADSKLFAETYREMLCQNYGFICFSATCDDPVLWAHYGDKNRGIALEFNWPLHDRWLKEVDYTDDRPSINIQSMNDNNNVHNFEQAVKTKWMRWRYEQEYRLLCKLGHCMTQGGIYYYQFATNYLSRVILGSNCDPHLEAYIVHARAERGLKNVKVARACLCSKTYNIIIR